MFVETKREGELEVKYAEPWRKALLDAAALIEKRGLMQRALSEFILGSGRVCARGALFVALHGTTGVEPSELLIEAECRLGAFIGCGMGCIPAWNDADGRTASEVIAAMRNCALS